MQQSGVAALVFTVSIKQMAPDSRAVLLCLLPGPLILAEALQVWHGDLLNGQLACLSRPLNAAAHHRVLISYSWVPPCEAACINTGLPKLGLYLVCKC